MEAGGRPLRLMSVVALALLVASPAQARFDAKTFHRRVVNALAAVPTPGLAVAVVDGDRIVFQKGYGVRRLGGAARVDAHTVFGIASCTKTFAAASIAALVDDGKLGWDDKVVRYLPWFAANDPKVTSELTIRDLLAFRTGLRSAMPREVARDRMMYLQAIRYVEPKIPFRSGWSYSNDTMTLAGDVVRVASGEPWTEFVRRRFWRPLGMSRTNADHLMARDMPNHATPHVDGDHGFVPVLWLSEDEIVIPSVGMNSSVHDLASWLRLQLGDGKAGRTQILSPGVMREMHVPVTPGSRDSKLPLDRPQWTLGWESYRYKGTQVLHKEGTTSGFKCEMTIVPERRFGIVTLINSDHPALLDIIHRDALDLKLGGDRQDVTALAKANDARQRPDDRASSARLLATRRPVPADDPARNATSFIGSYTDDGRIGTARIMIADGRPILEIGRLTFDLEAWGPGELRAQARWPFKADDDAVWWGALVDLQMDHGAVSGISVKFLRSGGTFMLQRSESPR